jgi:uncharacterized membrane protein
MAAAIAPTAGPGAARGLGRPKVPGLLLRGAARRAICAGMIEFLAAYAAFLIAHALPGASGLRGALIARLGRGGYMALYSLASLGLLAWLVSAAARAPWIPLWEPSRALALAPFALMPLACLLLAAGALRPNPASLSFRGGPAEPERPGILALIRHPVLWALALWGVSHAAANGDLVSVMAFGGFALFALIGMVALERRAARRGEKAALALQDGPLAARLRRAASPRLAAELAAGVALYALLLHLHGPVIGVDPYAWL